MSDLLPPDIAVWHFLEARARETFRRFGYQEIRTPVLEDTALFVRSVGETTDIVGKEMYTFEDKAGRSLSLRPENTAPAVRAYIEHAVNVREPLTRWYYLGPMFRYERMKTGRYRQFWQMGAEAYGSAEPAQDAELIDLGLQFFDAVGLSGIRLELNSLGDEVCRPAYLEALRAYLRAHQGELCTECQERIERNPLRVLDCKNPKCQAIVAGAPLISQALCEPCREHFLALRRKLDAIHAPYTFESADGAGAGLLHADRLRIHLRRCGAGNGLRCRGWRSVRQAGAGARWPRNARGWLGDGHRAAVPAPLRD